MQRAERLNRELTALRNLLSLLREASGQINDGEGLERVLQGVVDVASELTSSRYGAVAAVSDDEELLSFVTYGLTAEEGDDLLSLDMGLRFFRYLKESAQSVRIRDFEREYAQMTGLAAFDVPFPVNYLMATPILIGGRVYGFLFVGKTDGEEYTDEDEEALVQFASQAALVINNANRYRSEQLARERMETLVNTSPVGVAVFDPKTGLPQLSNPEAERLFAYMSGPGESISDLMGLLTIRRGDGSVFDLEEVPLSRLLRSAETVRAEEIVIARPDGKSLPALVNATPVHAKEGHVESLIVTIQDMTALEDLERLRAEFLGMVSHELRTPLTSIKGSTTTLLDASTNLNAVEARQFISIIDSQADRMRAMVSDLLDVAHIETGTLSVNPEPSEVAFLVDQARNTFMSAGGRDSMSFDVDPNLPTVLADRPRIIQVLTNLLSNAARHSPAQSPISVSAKHQGAEVVFSITDMGRGMPADRLRTLFRKFSRPDGEERTGDSIGSGLGLAICKGIVEAHGGRIWAESDGPGLGARFAFTLPLTVGRGTGGTLRQDGLSASSRPPEQLPRVLVVDDDPNTLRLVRDGLVASGYTPIVTADPEAAVALMADNEPNLLLLDMMLPNIDGVELMQKLLDIAIVPVIFLSAYGQDKIVSRAFDMGAADYMVKPFSPTELAARIGAALRRYEEAEPVQPTEPYAYLDLNIDYLSRSVTLKGCAVNLTGIEYRMLAELSMNAGRDLSYEHLLRRVWRRGRGADLGPMRTVVKSLRRKLGDSAANPTYIFTEARLGYRLAGGE